MLICDLNSSFAIVTGQTVTFSEKQTKHEVTEARL